MSQSVNSTSPEPLCQFPPNLAQSMLELVKEEFRWCNSDDPTYERDIFKQSCNQYKIMQMNTYLAVLQVDA